MSAGTTQTNHELSALRITRPQEQPKRKRNPLIPLFLTLLIVALLAAAGYFLYAKTLGRPPEVQTMMVVAQTGNQSTTLLTGSGYIVTRHKYITVGTKILGQIVEEPIEEGQRVKIGDILARIDDRDYQAQLRQAVAVRDVAKATRQLDEDKAARARELIGNGAISKDDWETAITTADVAQAELARDEAAVDYAKFNVNQCVITSPINGIVLKKYRELGDTINFGGEIQAGGGATDIAQLADTEDMRAEVDINEADIAKVGMGSPASVTLDAYPDKQFEAVLVKVYPEADRQKGTVKVEVQITHPDLQIIKPEMGAKVSFLAAKAKNDSHPQIVVPKSALKLDGANNYVWTVRDGVAKRTDITCGGEVEAGVEVKHGLDDGDVVIVNSATTLQDGLKVTAK